jgi:drug/metabolite transporter (DMT)-like permease
MNPKIVFLVLFAALLHASWNALVKTASDRLLVISAVALAQFLAGIVAVPFVPAPHPASWLAIAVATLFHYAYYVCLLNAYRFGDLSRVYPLARGSAPVLVALGAVFFAGESLPFKAAVGVVLASAGIAAIALIRSPPETKDRTAVSFALATGAIIAGYSVADGIGVRASGSPFGYICWLFICEFPVIVTVIYKRWGMLKTLASREWPALVGTGVCSILAYGFVIYAVAFAPMAPVSALRESGVVMAALIGTLVLGERPWPARVGAAILVAAGVVLITTT